MAQFNLIAAGISLTAAYSAALNGRFGFVLLNLGLAALNLYLGFKL